MQRDVLDEKPLRLFLVLGAFFVTNAILAEFTGVKIFSLERTLGLLPARWRILGEERSFDLTAGVLLWPVVFVMTDLVNEYFGRRGVRLLSFLAVAMIGYAYLAILGAMELVPADFWVRREIGGVPLDMEQAFDAVFGQGRLIIFGSVTAFLVGQLADVAVFHAVKRRTGERLIWLRATGSTVVSQLIDSFLVLLIAFHWGGPRWDLARVLSIGLVNYAYKFGVALLATPAIYLAHAAIERYLGRPLAAELRARAMHARRRVSS